MDGGTENGAAWKGARMVQVLLILPSCFAFVLESLKSVKLVLCICELLEFRF